MMHTMKFSLNASRLCLIRLNTPNICRSFTRFKHKRELHVEATEKAVNEEKAHRSAVFVTWLGLGKNITLCAGKAIIGVQSNSAALVADAFHSLSDMVSDAVAMVALKVARRPPNPLHPYGHGKFEAVGALGVSTMLMAAGGGLIFHAAELCWAAQAVVAPSSPALWASLACAGINEVHISPPLPPKNIRMGSCPHRSRRCSTTSPFARARRPTAPPSSPTRWPRHPAMPAIRPLLRRCRCRRLSRRPCPRLAPESGYACLC